jgi:2Fe-2S ferredoxin
MEAAIDNDIEGITAECGGACACATCHSYVSPEWLARLPKMDDMEDAMLDSAMDRENNSRLTCQITMTGELDGLEIINGYLIRLSAFWRRAITAGNASGA